MDASSSWRWLCKRTRLSVSSLQKISNALSGSFAGKHKGFIGSLQSIGCN